MGGGGGGSQFLNLFCFCFYRDGVTGRGPSAKPFILGKGGEGDQYFYRAFKVRQQFTSSGWITKT